MPLAAHRWGPAGAPTILAFHGFLDHGESFSAVAERLAPRWSMVAPDARGHGASGWVGDGANYSFYDYYGDAVAWLDSLGQNRVHVLGHSMGGMIATGLAALEPERVASVLLLDGMGPPERAAEGARDQLRRWVDACLEPALLASPEVRRQQRKVMPDLPAAADRLRRANPRLSPEMALRLAATGTEEAAGGVCWRHDPLHRTPGARPFRVDEARSLWQAMQMPVLSVYAEHSEWRPTDLDARHACLPRGRLALLPSAGHNLHHEQPEWIARIAEAWFGEERVVNDLRTL